ncbi:MAG: LOG family protein [Acidimicrobiia bacterium]
MSNKIIAVFGASKSIPGDGTYEDGVTCGRLLAEAGYGVVTGGYGGLMEAVSKGASEAGGHVLGVTVPAVFRGRAGANAFVDEERKAAHLLERIHQLTDISAGTIVLPGSLGTFTELGVAWNLAFVARFSGEEPKPVVTVGPTWHQLVNDLGSQLATDIGLIRCVATVDEAVNVIRQAVPA